MGKNRDLLEFSSTIDEVIGRLRNIMRDVENKEMNRELRLMSVRENANIALEFMNSMHQALEPDKTD
jgi:hypothetical protein